MQWMMLQQDDPEDFVIATGKQHGVREFCELAFAELGISLSWEEEGADEAGKIPAVEEGAIMDNPPQKIRVGDIVIRIDPRYFRPIEVNSPLEDATKTREKLGWSSQISFENMVSEMVLEDLNIARRNDLCSTHGSFAHQQFRDQWPCTSQIRLYDKYINNKHPELNQAKILL